MALLLRIAAQLRGDDIIRRTTVKGIVESDAGLLLLLTPASGDVKFPGGGVHHGESYAAALAREMREETGRLTTSPGRHVLTIIERRPAVERVGAVFEMTSHYFRVDVGEVVGDQDLDPYEASLAITPTVLPAREAWRANAHAAHAPWFPREQKVLRLVADGLI